MRSRDAALRPAINLPTSPGNGSQPLLHPHLHRSSISLEDKLLQPTEDQVLKPAMAGEDRLCTPCFLCALALLVVLLMPCVVPLGPNAELFESDYCACTRRVVAILAIFLVWAQYIWMD